MFKRLFSWWNGHTIGAAFDIKRRGSYVGTDEYGNKYYEQKKASIEGRKRRYVLYKGLAEPSKVPADWHGWLHHTVSEPPTKAPLDRRGWEADHKPNMTGTPYATKPRGAISSKSGAQKASGDYEAWTPDA